jgi:hypothetical protein
LGQGTAFHVCSLSSYNRIFDLFIIFFFILNTATLWYVRYHLQTLNPFCFQLLFLELGVRNLSRVPHTTKLIINYYYGILCLMHFQKMKDLWLRKRLKIHPPSHNLSISGFYRSPILLYHYSSKIASNHTLDLGLPVSIHL